MTSTGNNPYRDSLFVAIYPNSELDNVRMAIDLSGAELDIKHQAYDVNGNIMSDCFTLYRKTMDANTAGFGPAYAKIIGVGLPRGPIDTSKLPKETLGLNEILSKIKFD